MHQFINRFAAFCLVIHCIIASGYAASPIAKLSVAAGDFERDHAIASVAIELLPTSQSYAVRQDGRTVSSQLGDDRRLYFLVSKLAKGSTSEFEVSSASAPPRATVATGINVVRRGSQVVFDAGLRRLMAYQAEPGEFPRPDIKPQFRRGGYLHPIATPKGRVVTDDFPPNHIHHHGVWWAWTHTEFDGRKPDFWNMGDNKGRVEFESVEKTWSGPLLGGFRAQHRFVDLLASAPVTVLNETWQVTAYSPRAGSRFWVFDLVSEQQCATDKPLKLPTYRYGGVGLRGNWAWNGDGKALFLTSDGETDRVKGNTARARWCDMGGLIDGERAGIAVLGHPENFRAPQPMRLHPTEPFFNFAPQQAGDMAIRPGEKYVSKYRFVVHDGAPDRAELDRLWNDFAFPPVVTVLAK